MTSGPGETLQTVGDLIRWGASRLNAAGRHFGHGTDNAADEARVLVFYALALDFDAPDYFYQCRVTGAERQSAIDLIQQRVASGQPTAYLTGEAWFAGLRFEVNENVLVPRSPLAELIANGFAPWCQPAQLHRALDLGTGSGCIAIAMATHIGCRVDATDVSEQALAVAARNVAAHDLDDQVELIQSDVYEQLQGRRYDLIVSNPPYVPADSMATLPDEYGHEPDLALAAGDDGLDIVRRIISGAAEHLNPGGVLVCEVGESAQTVIECYPQLPFEWVDFQRGGDGVFVLRANALTEVVADVG
ncbi:MAG: 50S ribosomal protein L3 N(5)-glutamine methyltransferase [Gammaproteobacteria bacterium]|nr:50S ribosomal protein L3 N(5)-glutamine methyltransferase [Gammaproteobacteria bacterium]